MIDYLTGQVVQINATQLVLEQNGIGFSVNISLNTFGQLEGKTNCKVYTHLYVKNEGQSLSGFQLFGFAHKDERSLFELLISVRGISVNTARLMLSSMSPDELKQAIGSGNENAIKAVKGIGAKTAQRLILELKDKVDVVETDNTQISGTKNNTAQKDALSALVSLGFPKPAVEKTLTKILKQDPTATVEILIKDALKVL